jgi:hypothetical protein
MRCSDACRGATRSCPPGSRPSTSRLRPRAVHADDPRATLVAIAGRWRSNGALPPARCHAFAIGPLPVGHDQVAPLDAYESCPSMRRKRRRLISGPDDEPQSLLGLVRFRARSRRTRRAAQAGLGSLLGQTETTALRRRDPQGQVLARAVDARDRRARYFDSPKPVTVPSVLCAKRMPNTPSVDFNLPAATSAVLAYVPTTVPLMAQVT